MPISIDSSLTAGTVNADITLGAEDTTGSGQAAESLYYPCMDDRILGKESVHQ